MAWCVVYDHAFSFVYGHLGHGQREHFGYEDCKTDRVCRGEEQKLVDLYHTQLEDYAQALQRMTGRRVKEKYIYSFTLKKEILLG